MYSISQKQQKIEIKYKMYPSNYQVSVATYTDPEEGKPELIDHGTYTIEREDLTESDYREQLEEYITDNFGLVIDAELQDIIVKTLPIFEK
jgi:hypothetical protein